MKRLLLAAALLCAGWCHAGVEANTATEAELDSVKGLGPSSTTRILAAREKAAFKDWSDFMARVKGIKPPKAAQLSGAGLTVNGTAFEGKVP